jgi:Tfp pilus assembly major pilin PilA
MKTAMKMLAVLALCASLSACAGNSVQELETSLGASEATATIYVKLQPCSPTSGPICSKYSIVQTINNSRAAAKIAVDAARQAQNASDAANMYGLASTAASAFYNITNSSVVQNALKGE